MKDEQAKQLIRAAMEARSRAYAPYSHYKVGAALLTKECKLYTGCNIENAAYGPSNCAERTAIFKAVSEGEREFKAIAIVGGSEGEEEGQYAFPCGVCRQVMAEFVRPEEFYILIARTEQDYCVRTLAELLPDGFGPANLKNGD